MKYASKEQVQKIRIMLKQQDQDEFKDHIIASFSNERTSSTRELSFEEAKQLIKHLVENDGRTNLIKKLYAMAYKAKIIFDGNADDKKMNRAKLDRFLKEKGAVKKPLDKLTKIDLVKVVSQFEQIVKNNEKSHFGKGVKSLLNDLKISTLK